MRFLHYVLAVASLSFFAATAGATAASPQNGVDYTTLTTPQPTEGGKKVEVTEFFGYFCPHCYALEPAMAEWVKKQGDKISFKRVHVLFDPRLEPVQKMYVTLELMGKTELVHKPLFDAMHKERKQFNTDEALLAFVVSHGVDKAKYLEMFNSFSVQTNLRKANKALTDYAIDSVPQVFVDGRYKTSPDMLRASLGNTATEEVLAKGMVQVLDQLVDKVAKERAANAPKAAAPASATAPPAPAKKK